MEGKKGTIIIEDTRNFHSGNTVIKGHREIFQLMYTSHYFGGGKKNEFNNSLNIFKNKYKNDNKKYLNIIY